MKKKLTKPQMRVAIAKDVIAQLRAKKFQACMGTYLGIDVDIDGTAELKSELKKVPQCTVCALGALFVSDIRKNDACRGEEVGLGRYGDVGEEFTGYYADDSPMRDRLGKYFSAIQLGLIECAFERGCDPTYVLSDKQYHDAFGFGQTYLDAHECMLAIMKNIVRNEGVFKPKDPR